MNGLEALKKIENSYREQKNKLINDPFIHLHERMWFLTIERELKALEIIKNKRVCIGWVIVSGTFDNYLKWFREEHIGMKRLTQEEYDLLKGVLK